VVSPGEMVKAWVVSCWCCGEVAILPEDAQHNRARNVSSQAMAAKWARYAGWRARKADDGGVVWECEPCQEEAVRRVPVREIEELWAQAGGSDGGDGLVSGAPAAGPADHQARPGVPGVRAVVGGHR